MSDNAMYRSPLCAGDNVSSVLSRALDAGRQQGTVAVAVAEGLRAETVSRTGLVQTDAATALNIPAGTTAAAEWAMTYRYVTLPFELGVGAICAAPDHTSAPVCDWPDP